MPEARLPSSLSSAGMASAADLALVVTSPVTGLKSKPRNEVLLSRLASRQPFLFSPVWLMAASAMAYLSPALAPLMRSFAPSATFTALSTAFLMAVLPLLTEAALTSKVEPSIKVMEELTSCPLFVCLFRST